MTDNAERDRRLLAHLLAFLDRNEPADSGDAGKLRSIWDPDAQSPGKLKIRSCLAQLLESSVNIEKIAKELEPYKDEAIPVLVEGMGPDFDYSSIRSHASDVLEIIGDRRAVPLILHDFDRLVEYSSSSLMGLLKKIAAREGPETTDAIVDRVILYLSAGRVINPAWSRAYDHDATNLLETILDLQALTDARLPSLLERYIAVAPYQSPTFQLALLALSEIDAKRAALGLKKRMDAIEDDVIRGSHKEIGVLDDDRMASPGPAFLTILIRDRSAPPSEESPYSFKYEKPLLYFLEEAQETRACKRLAGWTEERSEIIQLAVAYLGKWLPVMKAPTTKYSVCNGLLARSLDFERWRFRPSYVLPKAFPTIIYDSEWCRIKFSFEAGDYPYDHTTTYLQVYYGRLHALNDADIMVWNGERCWCWQRVEYALNFLDGLAPEAAIEVEYRPRIIEKYRSLEFAGSLGPVRRTVGLVSEIWKYYGESLFELFDLRRPELWEQFAHFMQEIQRIKRSNSYGLPALDKIC